MTTDWQYKEPLDGKQGASSSDERAKIAALFGQKGTTAAEEVDYVSAFEMEQEKAKEKPAPALPKEEVTQAVPSTITKDYKKHLADVMAQNKEDIAQIEEMHQLIDEKNKQNKKLQAISVAIDEL
ncbi:DUF5945 family protein [Streptococcus ictaluri]|uniref:Uncharacterized protein n=1 Tax=Streptococcus ictaluri 707-05 TaxID=764299 RepID=G5K344_9STRE|nr:DUF5945 family protein [Streptococcus ictaluri]EHI69757.1 hypothetical protein STRIC_1212 [Streptococcus ictaluri 707-05]